MSRKYYTVADRAIEVFENVKKYVKQLYTTPKNNEILRLACIEILKLLTEKILERSPLQFLFTKYLSSLDPKLLYSNSVLWDKGMDKLFQILYDIKIMTSRIADSAKQQYSTLCLKAKTEFVMELKNYSLKESRFDIFYSDLLSKNDDFKDLWEVVNISLILSNGNAFV